MNGPLFQPVQRKFRWRNPCPFTLPTSIRNYISRPRRGKEKSCQDESMEGAASVKYQVLLALTTTMLCSESIRLWKPQFPYRLVTEFLSPFQNTMIISSIFVFCCFQGPGLNSNGDLVLADPEIPDVEFTKIDFGNLKRNEERERKDRPMLFYTAIVCYAHHALRIYKLYYIAIDVLDLQLVEFYRNHNAVLGKTEWWAVWIDYRAALTFICILFLLALIIPIILFSIGFFTSAVERKLKDEEYKGKRDVESGKYEGHRDVEDTVGLGGDGDGAIVRRTNASRGNLNVAEEMENIPIS